MCKRPCIVCNFRQALLMKVYASEAPGEHAQERQHDTRVQTLEPKWIRTIRQSTHQDVETIRELIDYSPWFID